MSLSITDHQIMSCGNASYTRRNAMRCCKIGAGKRSAQYSITRWYPVRTALSGSELSPISGTESVKNWSCKEMLEREVLFSDVTRPRMGRSV